MGYLWKSGKKGRWKHQTSSDVDKIKHQLPCLRLSNSWPHGRGSLPMPASWTGKSSEPREFLKRIWWNLLALQSFGNCAVVKEDCFATIFWFNKNINELVQKQTAWRQLRPKMQIWGMALMQILGQHSLILALSGAKASQLHPSCMVCIDLFQEYRLNIGCIIYICK